jgi:hypothetical protein
MTAQISDRLDYLGRTFAISAVKGTGLFEPEQHGLRTVMMSTACWRGWHAHYAVEGEKLIVRDLFLNLHPDDLAKTGGKHPPLFGVAPRDDHFMGHVYEGVNVPVAYSGGILIGDGFIRELYVHMGFHPCWKYREVHELIFEDGRLLVGRDCSLLVAQLRQRLEKEAGGPKMPDRDSVERWVKECFSLAYPW